MNITIRPVPRSKPGYLLRKRKLARIIQRINAVIPEAFDEYVDYILSEHEVIAPEGINVREEILNLPEEEFNDLVKEINGINGVDPTNGA